MLLFGAGASVDAKLPDTYDLTREILKAVCDAPQDENREVLTYLAGGILFADGIAGRNPLRGRVDVEALFRAATRLSKWDDSDIGPFVSAWHPRFLQLAAGRRLLRGHWDQRPENVFAAAATELTAIATDLLWKRDHANDYLEPLETPCSVRKRD